MKKIKITNGLVFCEGGYFSPQPLYACGDRIVTEAEYLAAEDGESREEFVFDAAGGFVIPGLVDLHFHGCMGSDCCDGSEEALRTIAEYELRCGVTAITPATMTLPEDRLAEICRTAAKFSDPQGADFCGLYLEGPFISSAKKGAQNAAYIRAPEAPMFTRLMELSGGRIRTAAIAPEAEGALDFIRTFAGKVRISLGHTTATYDEAMEALSCGASQLTHMFNAMPPFTHREPGPIGAAADSPHCTAELICDGIHVHPSAVRAAFRLFGDERIIFISDSMRAAGLSDGVYDLGGQDVTVRGNLATLSNGTIAGSVTNLMDCVRTAVLSMGIPLASAVKCASLNPAKALGISQDHGSLSPGRYANLVVLSEKLTTRAIFHHGTPVQLR